MKKAIICDIDGTLALLDGRNPYDPETVSKDKLNEPVADILKVYHLQKPEIDIILVTGRNDTYKKETINWLKKHHLDFYENLFMRGKNDFRKDVLLKREIYQNYINGKYEVLFVLDDRNQVVEMWRDEGLTCLQVAPGDF